MTTSPATLVAFINSRSAAPATESAKPPERPARYRRVKLVPAMVRRVSHAY